MHVDAKQLVRGWTHSHEEDHDGLTVFRPADYRFPPSRGRQSFRLEPNGALVHSGPAPDDRTQRSEGRWKFEGNVLTLTGAGRSDQRFIVEAVDSERLVLREIG